MSKQVSERELLQLQIQAYEFYAGLIDRAVGAGTHEAKLPKWDEQRAIEYRQLAQQLRERLAELEKEAPQELDAPGVIPVPTTADTETSTSSEEMSNTTPAANG